jgi:hypothetical protein
LVVNLRQLVILFGRIKIICWFNVIFICLFFSVDSYSAASELDSSAELSAASISAGGGMPGAAGWAADTGAGIRAGRVTALPA